MSAPKCPICGKTMNKHGYSSSGKQRWRCKKCSYTKTHKINTDAKNLELFLAWLFSKQRQVDMPGGGRAFRYKTARFWEIWPMPPLIDEIFDVVYVDGIHLGRKAVVLIACSDKYVLGWYLAKQENTRAYKALLSRIAPPNMVVTDGGTGFATACKKIWPETQIQRCVFHAFNQVKRYTTTKPKLNAGVELYKIAKDLLYITTQDQALWWLRNYFDWCEKWDDFLSEVTITDGRKELTHYRLVCARNSLNKLINTNHLFTFLDEFLTLDGQKPKTNNKIEGGVNAPLRQMLREHRGMSLMRRIKAIFWWCYMHTECHLGAADILKVMPTDKEIDGIYRRLTNSEKLSESIPQWGDAIMWSELHMIDYSHQSFRHDWD